MTELYHYLDQLDTLLASLIDNDYIMTAETNDLEDK